MTVRVRLERAGELAPTHAGADFGRVASVIKEVGVDVERGGWACEAEDAADLNDIEAKVDDQRWLANVWRRSWKRNRLPSRSSPAHSGRPGLAWLRQMISGDVWVEAGAAKT